MKTYLGNTSTELLIKNTELKDCIVKYILTNIGSGPILLNVFMGNTNKITNIFRIAPKNLSIAAGESFVDDNISMVEGGYFKFTTTGTTDYYISVEPHVHS